MQLIIRTFGLCDYQEIWQRMKAFTDNRNENTTDELWLLQHHPVYTQGQAGKPEHVLNPGDIPVIQTDRGGQVTYHGPGQLVAYTLFDLNRLKMGTRQLVRTLEKTIVDLLSDYGISAAARCDAPGVYVGDAKICSIGLRVRHGCSYHGIAFNINMDLSPFSRINPCGFSNLSMVQLSHFQADTSVEQIETPFIKHLVSNFNYNHYNVSSN